MTRAQRKEAYSKLQHALGHNFARNKDSNYGNKNENCDFNCGNENNYNEVPEDNTRELNIIMNELPDNYLCEGSPDKMMMDTL